MVDNAMHIRSQSIKRTRMMASTRTRLKWKRYESMPASYTFLFCLFLARGYIST